MDQIKFKNWLNLNFESVLETSDDFRINCPFCNDDTNHHMYISKTKLVAHCFRCNWGGHRNKFILEFLGYDDLKQYLTSGLEESYIPVSNRLSEFMGTFESSTQSPSVAMEMPDWFVKFNSRKDIPSIYSAAIYNYAIDRITINNIRRYNIGYCKDLNSKFAHRMIIPTEKGYFQARAISRDQKIKYLNPTIPIEDCLFNGIALESYDKIYICEGAISAIAIGNDAVATLTKAAHQEQIDRMIKSEVKTFVIAYDSGTEYSSGTLKLADMLYRNGKTVIVRFYKNGDPDSCDDYAEQFYDTKYAIIGKLDNPKIHRPINLFR